jgi:DNA polymerase I
MAEVHYIFDQGDMYKVNNWLDTCTYTAFDLETGPQEKYINTDHEATAGLDPYMGRVILILLGDLENRFIIDTRADLDLSHIQCVVENDTIPKYGLNLRFDCKYVMHHYGWLPRRLVDAQIIEQVIRVGIFSITKEAKVGMVRKMTSMASLVKFYFNETIDKDKTMRIDFWKTPPGKFSKRQIEYFKGDIAWPIRIAKAQSKIAAERGLMDKLRSEFDLIPVLAQMELEGMTLDVPKWLGLYHHAVKQVAEGEKKLDKLLGVTNLVQEDLLGDATILRSVNYGSPVQVAKLMERNGIPGFYDSYNSKMLGTESKKFIIGKLMGDIPAEITDTMVKFRQMEQRRDSYGLNFINKLHPVTGKIHPDYTQAILTTLRISCSPGLQTIPRDEEYRASFVAGKGYVFSIVDASQIEARIITDMTRDPVAIDVFKKGLDVYKEDGELFYGVAIDKKTPEGKKLRDNAKAAWLGLGYGQGKKAFRFYMMMNLRRFVSQEESDFLYDKFFEVHYIMKEEMDSWSESVDPERSDEWFEDQLAKYKVNPSYAYENVYKRLLAKSKGDTEKAKARTTRLLAHPERVRYSECYGGGKRFYRCDFFGWYNASRNHRIQGGAAHIQKVSMIDIFTFIAENDIDAALVQTVHDEIVVKVREQDAAEFHEHHKRLMVEAGERYLKHVPMKVEGGIDYNLKKF